MAFFSSIFFLGKHFHCSSVLNEQATDGSAIMTVELSTIVDLFLMCFPIMQAIISIRSYPRGSALQEACVVPTACSGSSLVSAAALEGSWALQFKCIQVHIMY